MPWVKVDENFHNHPKVIEAAARLEAADPQTAGATAHGRVTAVWQRAMCHHNGALTDGFISDVVARELLRQVDMNPIVVLTAMEAPARRGLVTRVKGGWEFVSYHEYQPSKEYVEKKREKNRKRMQKVRAGRARNVHAHKKPRARNVHAVCARTEQNVHDACALPDPIRSGPIPVQDQNLPALRAGTFPQTVETPDSLTAASSCHEDSGVQTALSDCLEHAGLDADRRLRVGGAHQAPDRSPSVRAVSEAAPDHRRDAGGGTGARPDTSTASPSEARGAAARVPVVAGDGSGGVDVGRELDDPRDRRAALTTARSLSQLTPLSEIYRIGPKRTKGAA